MSFGWILEKFDQSVIFDTKYPIEIHSNPRTRCGLYLNYQKTHGRRQQLDDGMASDNVQSRRIDTSIQESASEAVSR